MDNSTPTLLEIKLLQKKKTLLLKFDEQQEFTLTAEYLRVFSPSAEVQGHGQKEPNLITGKQEVNIVGIEPVGHYAVKLIFDDGHDTGIYSFEKLYELAVNYENNWDKYQKRISG